MLVAYIEVPDIDYDNSNYYTVYKMYIHNNNEYINNSSSAIIKAINLGEAICGVSRYALVFEGYQEGNTWFGTYYREDGGY